MPQKGPVYLYKPHRSQRFIILSDVQIDPQRRTITGDGLPMTPEGPDIMEIIPDPRPKDNEPPKLIIVGPSGESESYLLIPRSLRDAAFDAETVPDARESETLATFIKVMGWYARQDGRLRPSVDVFRSILNPKERGNSWGLINQRLGVLLNGDHIHIMKWLIDECLKVPGGLPSEVQVWMRSLDRPTLNRMRGVLQRKEDMLKVNPEQELKLIRNEAELWMRVGMLQPGRGASKERRIQYSRELHEHYTVAVKIVEGPDGGNEMQRREVIDMLLPALGDPEEEVRGRVAAILGLLKADSAVEVISGMLAAEESEYVRAWSAYALGRIGELRGVPALTGALRDPSDRVQDNAAEALYNMRGQIPPMRVDLWKPIDDRKKELDAEVAGAGEGNDWPKGNMHSLLVSTLTHIHSG